MQTEPTDEPDGLAFWDRPDGNNIEVRCHTGNWTRAHIVTGIEELIGLTIWTAQRAVGRRDRGRCFREAAVVEAAARAMGKRGAGAGGLAAAWVRPGGGVPERGQVRLGVALMGQFALGWLRDAISPVHTLGAAYP